MKVRTLSHTLKTKTKTNKMTGTKALLICAAIFALFISYLATQLPPNRRLILIGSWLIIFGILFVIEGWKGEPKITTRKAFQLCPKCNGQGHVSLPPCASGDIHHYQSTGIAYECNLCKGKMVIPM